MFGQLFYFNDLNIIGLRSNRNSRVPNSQNNINRKLYVRIQPEPVYYKVQKSDTGDDATAW